jgi:hypothetical protein
MQTATLSARKLALMVANGFDETQFVELQKLSMQNNTVLKIVSATSGLVNSAATSGMPMSYPVDASLSETLAIDYDALILIEGKHLDTLKEEPHAGRIIRAFLRSEMPVLSVGSAAELVEAFGEDVSAADIQALAPQGRNAHLLFASDKTAFSAAARDLAEAIADSYAALEAEEAENEAA